MSQEVVLGLMFLSGVLQPDTTLQSLAPGGVWRGSGDIGIATPYIIVAWQSGTDALTTTGVRPLTHIRYQVKAVGPANATLAVASAADRMDVLLGGNSGLRNQSVAGGFIGSCYRDGMLMVDQEVAGEKWVSIGGFYMLDISQTS